MCTAIHAEQMAIMEALRDYGALTLYTENPLLEATIYVAGWARSSIS